MIIWIHVLKRHNNTGPLVINWSHIIHISIINGDYLIVILIRFYEHWEIAKIDKRIIVYSQIMLWIMTILRLFIKKLYYPIYLFQMISELSCVELSLYNSRLYIPLSLLIDYVYRT